MGQRDPYERTIGTCDICGKIKTKIIYFLGKDFCMKCFRAKKQEIAAYDAEYNEKLLQTIR